MSIQTVLIIAKSKCVTYWIQQFPKEFSGIFSWHHFVSSINLHACSLKQSYVLFFLTIAEISYEMYEFINLSKFHLDG